MRVLVADPLDESAIKELREAGFEVEDLSGLPKDKLLDKVADFDIMTVRSATKVRKELIDRMQKMKLIIRGGVGIDNIDVEYAKTKGIKVMNTPMASSASVAELVLAHMFALARFIVRGTRGISEGLWEKKTLEGTELSGKRLGIIGVGRIGIELARRASALGMEVIGYDPYVKSAEFVRFVEFDELLRSSDYISVHTPLTDETRHMIGAEEFAKMKAGVILINCARGGIVDETALLSALKSGKVGGAGLDVFEHEPPPMSELLKLPNVTCTPHIGAATREAQERIGAEVVSIIKSFAK